MAASEEKGREGGVADSKAKRKKKQNDVMIKEALTFCFAHVTVVKKTNVTFAVSKT